jgi:hypothetical protein
MDFQTLQDRLRKLLRSRVETGDLTGLSLARRSGFRQAHISNFLNQKRGLSLDAMDRILEVLRLDIFDLLEPVEVNRHASKIAPSEDDFENVVLVDGGIAATEPLITGEHVKDVLKFKKNFLRRLRADIAGSREHWSRFLLVKVDAHNAMSMYPRLLPGATLLIDRHYNSLRPYHRKDRNMYAVRAHQGCVIRYVELAGQNLVLRPHNEHYPVSVLPIEEGNTFDHYIVGRICHIATET